MDLEDDESEIWDLMICYHFWRIVEHTKWKLIIGVAPNLPHHRHEEDICYSDCFDICTYIIPKRQPFVNLF